MSPHGSVFFLPRKNFYYARFFCSTVCTMHTVFAIYVRPITRGTETPMNLSFFQVSTLTIFYVYYWMARLLHWPPLCHAVPQWTIEPSNFKWEANNVIIISCHRTLINYNNIRRYCIPIINIFSNSIDIARTFNLPTLEEHT